MIELYILSDPPFLMYVGEWVSRSVSMLVQACVMHADSNMYVFIALMLNEWSMYRLTLQ